MPDARPSPFPGVRFARMTPNDLLTIDRQPSQRLLLGQSGEFTREEAEQLAAMPEAWTCFHADRIVACVGISDMFAGRHGIAWSLLAQGIGQAHLALTRFVRGRLAMCGHERLDTFARAPDLETILARRPHLDSGQIVALAMADPTPECRWAALLGFRPAHVLRRYGALGESVMLFERIRVAHAAAPEREAA